jgi:hypothetical protein
MHTNDRDELTDALRDELARANQRLAEQPLRKPAREWVNLTVDELIDLEHKHLHHEDLVRAIEAKLKEKNA